jgi:uncharacterized membrane protein
MTFYAPKGSNSNLDEYPENVRRLAARPRLWGAIITGLGIFTSKWLIIDNLENIKNTHPDHVSTFHAAVIFPPILMMLGMIYLIFGTQGVFFMARKKNGRFKWFSLQGLVSVIMGLLALGVMIWYDQQLKMLGYQ